MKRYKPPFLSIFLLILTLCSCIKSTTGISLTPELDPEQIEISSPEAVALSLSTVDPEAYLPLFAYDPDFPLDIQEENRWEEGNATWIDFNYASPLGGRVPARLVIPDGKGPFPGMILMHGGPGTLKDMDSFAKAFTRYGAVTLMITSPYRRPGGWEITEYMGNTWPIFNDKDLRIKIQLINDLQRGVDILLEQPQVDPEKLAYFGVSWGASMGGLLAGIEDRIDAYVLAVGDGGLVEHTADPGEDGINIHFSENWAAMMWPTEPLHYVGRAAPAALLFQNGINDSYVPAHDAIRFFTAASEPKEMLWYDAGHGLPWRFVEDAAGWLQPYLGDRLFIVEPNYRPSALTLDRILIALIVLPALWLLWDIIRQKTTPWVEAGIWLGSTALIGPLGAILYWFSSRSGPMESDPGPARNFWKRILGVASLTTIAAFLGLQLGDQINDLLGLYDFRLRFGLLYLTTFLASWILARFIRDRYQKGVFATLLVVNIIWAVEMIFPSLLMKWINISQWWFDPAMIILWILLTFPLHSFLGKRLFISGPCQIDRQEPEALRPIWKIILLAGSFIIALGSVVLLLRIYTEYPWKMVFEYLFRLNSG